MREFSVPASVRVDDGDTLSDTVFALAEEHPGAVALRRRLDDGWVDVTYAAFTAEVVAVARGLIASGIEPGDRVALLSRTRYEWTLFDYAIVVAGAVTVPIYETSSADQVAWILADSGAKAVIVEDDRHAATVTSRPDAPEHIWRIAPDGDWPGAVQMLTTRGASVPAAQAHERRRAARADDLATLIYTSGTTGRPKGCEITHANLVAEVRTVITVLPELLDGRGSLLLFLPLAHVFGKVVQCAVLDSRTVLGHSPDAKHLLDDLAAFRPTVLLAVPRVFEKVFHGARRKAVDGGKGKIFDAATATAVAWSEACDAGGPGVGLKLRRALFDVLVYRRLRAALGGRVRAAVSGSAPLTALLGHFFRGIGLPVLEGYGLTETTAAISVNTLSAHRIGTVGRPIPGLSVRIADDGEILVTAGGKNVAPAVLEDRLRAHPLIGQVLVVGDGQPFIAALVTVDADALPRWRQQHGKAEGAGSAADLVDDPELRGEIAAAVEEANRAVSRAEQIRKFRILPGDFSEEGGELTPTLKVRRSVVTSRYADDIAALYSGVNQPA